MNRAGTTDRQTHLINFQQLIWILTIILTVIASAVDVRKKKIPNWLSVPGIVCQSV